MSDFINLTCPTCGSTIEPQENNQFICQSCQNKFLLKQDGSQISLVPVVAEKGTLIEGNHNVVVNVNTGTSQADPLPAQSEVECPVCGKILPLNQTFRCRRCGRPHICTVHQDPKTYLCQECVNTIRNEQKKKEVAERSEMMSSRQYKSGKAFSKITITLAFIAVGAGAICALSAAISEIGIQFSYAIYNTFYNLSYLGFYFAIAAGGLAFLTGIVTWAKGRAKSGMFGIGALIIAFLLTAVGNLIHGWDCWY